MKNSAYRYYCHQTIGNSSVSTIGYTEKLSYCKIQLKICWILSPLNIIHIYIYIYIYLNYICILWQ